MCFFLYCSYTEDEIQTKVDELRKILSNEAGIKPKQK